MQLLVLYRRGRTSKRTHGPTQTRIMHEAAKHFQNLEKQTKIIFLLLSRLILRYLTTLIESSAIYLRVV
jgi:hypothetical protein